MESVWPSLVAKQHKTLVLVWRTLYMHPTSLFPRLSPWTTTKKSEEESLVPFCTWCTAHQCHSFNDLFCYVTTTELQLLWQQKIDREIILMAMTAKEVTWWYRQPGILVQFTISIECNLLILLFLYTIIVASECKGQLRAAVWILPGSANGVVTVSIWYCLSRTKVTHLDPTGCSRTHKWLSDRKCTANLPLYSIVMWRSVSPRVSPWLQSLSIRMFQYALHCLLWQCAHTINNSLLSLCCLQVTYAVQIIFIHNRTKNLH